MKFSHVHQNLYPSNRMVNREGQCYFCAVIIGFTYTFVVFTVEQRKVLTRDMQSEVAWS
ncbi:MAG: hypothetical protein JRF72_17365 [Deltaproteobacteria bacterium]|nr:hypothetical protein [Deltaproteobacteria bacterium]